MRTLLLLVIGSLLLLAAERAEAQDLSTLRANITTTESAVAALDASRNFSFLSGEWTIQCRTYASYIDVAIGKTAGGGGIVTMRLASGADFQGFVSLATAIQDTAGKLRTWQQGGAHP